MGRPPIGKVAMTVAERVRRYRLKRGKDKPVTKVTKPDAAALAALRAENAALRATLAELGQQLAQFSEERDQVNTLMDQARDVLRFRIGVYDKRSFTRLLACVFVDKRKSLSDAELNWAFNALKEKEHVLVKPAAKPSPSRPAPPPMPKTAAGWAALKEQIRAEKAAKRAANKARRKEGTKHLA